LLAWQREDEVNTGEASKGFDVLAEYSAIIDESYALYLDTTAAMSHFAKFFEEQQKLVLQSLIEHATGATTIEELDKANIHYGIGDANTDQMRVQHESTQGDFKARNRKGGINARSMSRILLVTIYQFWEDHYRSAFGEAVGKIKNEILSDFFGDIRFVRNDIIHHRNIATSDIKRCKILKFFEPGHEICLDEDQVQEVVKALRISLDQLCLLYTGESGSFADRLGVSGIRYA
jgi:hypothetical protein